jgi:hypothetical protein
LIVFTATLLAASGSSHAFEIKDGDFASGWQFVAVQTANGGSFDATITGGGIPGNQLITHTHINGGCGAIFGFGFRTDRIWDPATQGPIVRLDYSEDARLVNGFGGGQAIGPAIRQGGNYYRLPGSATGTNTNWFTLSLGSLSASQFIKVNPFAACNNDSDPSSHPDFSANGFPIEFGFVRANSQIDPFGAYDITAAIDNFHVSVNGVAYVAMGDSYSSGEGLPDFIPGTDVPGVNVCHRSRKAYGWLIQFPRVDLTTEDFLACSGAMSINMRPGGPHPTSAQGEPAQMDRFYPPPRNNVQIVNANTEMVTLTAGGNDLGFSEILQECAFTLDCASNSYKPFPNSSLSFKQAIQARLAWIAPFAGILYSAVTARAPDASVLVAGYPRLFGKNPVCVNLTLEPFFSKSERKWLDELGDDLNLALWSEASYAGVHFVSVSGAFKGHGTCDLFPWINGLTTNQTFAFHPTAAGQWAYASSLDLYMHGWVDAGLPVTPAGLPRNPGSFSALEPTAPRSPAGSAPPSLARLVVSPSGSAPCDTRGAYVAGQQAQVIGDLFGANQTVTLTLRTDAYVSVVATVVADGAGKLSAVVTIPAGSPTNADALLEATGVGADGEPRLLVGPLHLSTSFSSDADFDEIPDPCDLCPAAFDYEQLDADGDRIGDACDACPTDPENDLDADSLCAASDPCPWDPQNDADADGTCESFDNCPLVANASQLDSDNDGAGDACDLAPLDPGAFAIPGEVDELSLRPDKVTLTWSSVALTSGFSTVHDLVRGSLDDLPVGAATCLAATSGETATDLVSPPSGQGFWYLVRGRNSLGNGTYGYQSNGTERVPSACP